MTREEFNIKCRKFDPTYTDTALNDYKRIEFVYNYYPTISETEGKEQISYLYMTHGMAIIRDMYERANRIKLLEEQQNRLRSEMNEISHQIKCITYGVN